MAEPISIGVVLAAFGVLSALGVLFPPLGRWSTHFQNRFVPNEIPDVITLAAMRAKRILDPMTFTDLMEKQGINKDIATFLEQASWQSLQVGDYIHANFRDIIDEESLMERLDKCGVGDFDKRIIQELSQYFPTVPDLVRFAVREVYSPDVVSKFGQKDDLPDKFIKEAAKAGLPEEQAENYWAAHWDLPSATQGFEMFQRRVISEEELNMLLRALDVMPFWRDKLTEIAYNPLTRVDVRRMYGLGILDKNGVYESYLDFGYSPKNAKLMTQFTIDYENDEYKGITRASVINAYKEGVFNERELRQYLEGFKYSPEVVEYWISQANYEKAEAEIKLVSDDLAELYQMGAIDLSQVRNELNQLDLPSKYMDNLIQKLIVQKARRTKVPTKEDLQAWLDLQVIDENYYTIKMRLLGYQDRDIENYLTYMAKQKDTSKAKLLGNETYMRWLENGIIDENRFRKLMHEKNIGEKDINSMIDEVRRKQDEATQ